MVSNDEKVCAVRISCHVSYYNWRMTAVHSVQVHNFSGVFAETFEKCSLEEWKKYSWSDLVASINIFFWNIFYVQCAFFQLFTNQALNWIVNYSSRTTREKKVILPVILLAESILKSCVCISAFEYIYCVARFILFLRNLRAFLFFKKKRGKNEFEQIDFPIE